MTKYLRYDIIKQTTIYKANHHDKIKKEVFFMKKTGRLLFITIASVLTMLSTPLGVNAELSNCKKNVMQKYILSASVPNAAVEYANQYFSTYTESELLDLSFTPLEIKELSLSEPITAYEYDKCDSNRYYFPILHDDNVVAMLTMVDPGDGYYSIQLGKSKFADSLNKIHNTINDPVSLVITDEAMYTIDKNDTLTVVDEFLSSSNLSNKSYIQPQISYDDVTDINENIVFINSQAYIDFSNKNPVNSTRTIIQNGLNVPFVSNGTNNSYPLGYCWASSAASVIKYRTTTSSSATQIRDQLLLGGYAGYDTEVQTIFQSYIGGTITLLSGNGFMFYNTLKPIIDDGKPIYTDWQSFTSGEAHAMVVRGYYNDTAISGPLTERATLMDPNHSTYQSIGLYPTFKYSIGTGDFQWYSSVY